MNPTGVAFAAGVLAIVGLAAGRAPRRVPGRVPRAWPAPPPSPCGEAPPWVGRLVDEIGLSVDAPTVWAGARAGVVIAATVTVVLAGPLLAGLLVGAAVAAPLGIRSVLERRWWDRRDQQLPVALERLAADIRAGSGLGPAFIGLAADTPDPLGAELSKVGAEIRHGAGLGVALDRWASGSHASTDVRLAAGALGLGAEAGGEIARSIDRVAATLRERRELRAEVRALATQARASAGVLAVAPLGFTALVSTIEPTTVRFLTTSAPGVACLVGGLGLEAAGAAWMARILRSVS